jgi:hypothetical protein
MAIIPVTCVTFALRCLAGQDRLGSSASLVGCAAVYCGRAMVSDVACAGP